MSIPSKWEPNVPEYKARPKTVYTSTKGFGVRTERFDNSHINDRPGPGYYDKPIDGKSCSMILNTPSLSRKGLGNAFVSKSVQLEDREKYKHFIPGPGAYNAKRLPSVKSCPSFNRGSEGRVPFAIGPKTPGPCDYKIHPNPGVPILLKNKISATFASVSKRESFLENFSDAPGVGRYDATITAISPGRTDYGWSRRRAHRFSDRDYDNSVPGPGAYFAADASTADASSSSVFYDGRPGTTMTTTTTTAPSARTAGAYRGPYLGKQNAAVAANMHTFGADKERFKHSFIGFIEPNPGPGAYNVAAADSVITKDPPKAFSNVFRSHSPNRADVVKKIFDRPPGPAYYEPKMTDARLKCQNLDGRWI